MAKIRSAVIVLSFGLALAVEGPAQDPWQTVRIEADEHRFVPNEIVLVEGRPVRIEIHNKGNEEHEFRSAFLSGPLIEVQGKGLTVKGTGIHSVVIESGETAAIKWLAPIPGRYYFECRIPSHHGMDGTIIVEMNPPSKQPKP